MIWSLLNWPLRLIGHLLIKLLGPEVTKDTKPFVRATEDLPTEK